MLQVKPVTDHSFAKYGKIITGFDTAALIEAMSHTPAPENVVYVASVPELEALDIYSQMSAVLYGGMPIQIGYCNGENHRMDALEYHRDSEINLACTDLILMLACEQDIDWDTLTLDTAKVEAFRVPAGTLLEVYGTTLHYAPVSTGEGEKFRCVVVLPRGTNAGLTEKPAPLGVESKILWAVNKWLLAHPDSADAAKGAYVGLKGENWTL